MCREGADSPGPTRARIRRFMASLHQWRKRLDANWTRSCRPTDTRNRGLTYVIGRLCRSPNIKNRSVDATTSRSPSCFASDTGCRRFTPIFFYNVSHACDIYRIDLPTARSNRDCQRQGGNMRESFTLCDRSFPPRSFSFRRTSVVEMHSEKWNVNLHIFHMSRRVHLEF